MPGQPLAGVDALDGRVGNDHALAQPGDVERRRSEHVGQPTIGKRPEQDAAAGERQISAPTSASSNMVGPGASVPVSRTASVTRASTISAAATQSAASPPIERRGCHTLATFSGAGGSRAIAGDTLGLCDSLSAAMRIALNAQLLSQAAGYRSGGINRVIYGLLGELARDPRGHHYDVFVPELPPRPEHVDGAARGLDDVRFLVTGNHTQRPSMRIAWEQSVLPLQLARLRPDLIHGLAYALPLAWPGPAVVTIFDLSFLRFPETLRRGSRLYLATATRLSARRARRIVTISQAIRSDIVRLLNVDPSKVEVAYPAVDERYRPAPRAELEAFRQARQLPDEFVFSLGTLEPRKNLVGLLDAYAGLPTPRPPLYLAGGEGWAYTPIFNRMRELRLERDVRLRRLRARGRITPLVQCGPPVCLSEPV